MMELAIRLASALAALSVPHVPNSPARLTRRAKVVVEVGGYSASRTLAVAALGKESKNVGRLSSSNCTEVVSRLH